VVGSAALSYKDRQKLMQVGKNSIYLFKPTSAGS